MVFIIYRKKKRSEVKGEETIPEELPLGEEEGGSVMWGGDEEGAIGWKMTRRKRIIIEMRDGSEKQNAECL